jgi:tetratricopeptide (TPR) repeat protein
LSQLGRLDAAERHHRRAIEIWRATLGHDSPELARAYHNLAEVLGKRDDLEAAREFYELALRIKKKTLGDRHESIGQTANNLGDVLVRLGRPRDAIPLLHAAMDSWDHTLGPEHPNALYGLTSLMEAHIALDEPEAAIPYAQRAAAIAASVDALDPVVLGNARFLAAKVLWERESERGRALELARQAHDDYAGAQKPPAASVDAVQSWLLRRAKSDKAQP